MKKIIAYLITACITAVVLAPLFLVSFNSPECQHVYVEVQPVKVEQTCRIIPHPMIPINHKWVERKVGSHNSDHDEKNMAEGISLVCVKCHHEIKQKIQYTHDE